MLSVLFLCYSYTIAPGVKGKGKAGRIVGWKIKVLKVEKGVINEISDSVFVNPNAGYHGFDSNEIYDILLESYKD